MENIYMDVLIFFLGLIIGSFSNVCIYRIPREESIIFPGSHCPRCGETIRFYDNIPLLSFVLLKGKCRKCGNRIPLQYPLVELLTGLLYLLIYVSFGFQILSLIYMIFVSSLIIIAFIDIQEQIIPDILSLPFMILGFLSSFILPNISPIDSLIGILAGGGSLLFIAIAGSKIFKKEAMGGGDVKLAGMIGSYLGWQLTLLALFFGFLFGSALGVAILLKKRKEETVSFGPFIVLGTIISMFWGQKIIHWYLMM